MVFFMKKACRKQFYKIRKRAVAGKKNIPEAVLFLLGLAVTVAFLLARQSGKTEEKQEECFIMRKSLAGREQISVEEYLPELVMSMMEKEEEAETEVWKAVAVVLRSNLLAASMEQNRWLTYEEIGLETQNPEMMYEEWKEEEKERYAKAKRASEATRYQVLEKTNGLQKIVRGDGQGFLVRLREAGQMAKNGSDYCEILHSFFPNCEITKN